MMKRNLLCAALMLAASQFAIGAAEPPPLLKNPVSLFDGATLAGWEGDAKLWRGLEWGPSAGATAQKGAPKKLSFLPPEFTKFFYPLSIQINGPRRVLTYQPSIQFRTRA